MEIRPGKWMLVIGKALGKVVAIEPDGSIRLHNEGMDQGWICPADRLDEGLRELVDLPAAISFLAAAAARDVPPMNEGERRVLYRRAWRSGSFEQLANAGRIAVAYGEQANHQTLDQIANELCVSTGLNGAAIAALLPHILSGTIPALDLFEVEKAEERAGEAIGDRVLDQKLTDKGFPRLAEDQSLAWEVARQLEHDVVLAELALRGWLVSFDAENFYDPTDYEEVISDVLVAAGSSATVRVTMTDKGIEASITADTREVVIYADHLKSSRANVTLIVNAARKALDSTVKVQVFQNEEMVVLGAIPKAAAQLLSEAIRN